MYKMMSASDYRTTARNAITPNVSVLLMISFLASLPNMLATTIRTTSMGSGTLQELDQLYTAMMQGSDPFAVSDRMSTIMERYLWGSSGILSSLFSLIAAVVTPVLTLGLLACLIRLLRGETLQPADVLCRKDSFLRALWLSILTGLKMFLWALPGVGVMILGMVIMLVSPSTGTVLLYLLCFFAGMILMAVLMIRAQLHYTLSTFILADHPEMKASEALNASVSCMQNRKAALFGLCFSFIGWYLLNWGLTSIASTIWGVLGTVVSLALDLVLGLYVNTALTAFYLNEYCQVAEADQQPDHTMPEETGKTL